MEDISTRMLQFKDAIRHVWNTYFANAAEPMSPVVQEAFEHIEIGLLQALVLAPLNSHEDANQYRRHSLPFILVKPANGLRELPLQVGERQANGNVKWANITSIPVDDDCEFQFFDFFDWNPYGYIDLPYVRTRISSLATQPKIVGSLALIQQVHCRFYFKE